MYPPRAEAVSPDEAGEGTEGGGLGAPAPVQHQQGPRREVVLAAVHHRHQPEARGLPLRHPPPGAEHNPAQKIFGNIDKIFRNAGRT